MNQQINNKKFSTRIAIILGLALLVIGFTGWYVWQKNMSNDKDLSSDKSQQVDSQDSLATKDNIQTDQKISNNALRIEELGVQFTLPQNLSGDIDYVIKQVPVGNRFDFSSKKFNNSDFKCQAAPTTGPKPLVSIHRETDGEGGETISQQPFKRIGSDRYYFTTTSCEEELNRSGNAEQKQPLTELKSAISTSLEAIKQ